MTKDNPVLRVTPEFKTMIKEIALDYEKATQRWYSNSKVTKMLYNKMARADLFSMARVDLLLNNKGKMVELLPVIILDNDEIELAREILELLAKLDKPVLYATSENHIVIILLKGYPEDYFFEVAGGKVAEEEEGRE